MKDEFILQVVRQILLYVTLTFDSKVIAVIWIYYCYLHPTDTRFANLIEMNVALG